MVKQIPEGSELLQIGLYVYKHQRMVAGILRTVGELYSSNNYCFYDATLPEEGRLYMQFCTLAQCDLELTNEELSSLFVSIPIEEGMEIVSKPNKEVIA